MCRPDSARSPRAWRTKPPESPPVAEAPPDPHGEARRWSCQAQQTAPGTGLSQGAPSARTVAPFPIRQELSFREKQSTRLSTAPFRCQANSGWARIVQLQKWGYYSCASLGVSATKIELLGRAQQIIQSRLRAVVSARHPPRRGHLTVRLAGAPSPATLALENRITISPGHLGRHRDALGLERGG